MGKLEDVVAIAKVVGCPIHKRDILIPKHSYSWNGKTIAMNEGGKVRPLTNLVHDIAHFLVAPPERRWVAEFGLGTAPEGMRHIQAVVTMTTAESLLEEERASLLGILVEKALGMDWLYTMQDHSWLDFRSAEDVFENEPSIRWLQVNGFVDGNLLPRWSGDHFTKKRKTR